MAETEAPKLTPLEGLARLAALVFHYLAAEAVETLGPQEGAALVGRAISKMGEERGKSIRAAVDAAGLEPTLANLSRFYDLPIGQAWKATYDEVEPGHTVETVTHCPLADTWHAFDTPDIDINYCEIDMAIIRGYNPDIRIERFKSLLRADGCCVYDYRE